MEHKVTGCKDCPLFDSASGEYSIWCHHPERPIRILQYAGEAGWWNFPEAKLPNDIFDAIRKENAIGKYDFMNQYQKENDVHFHIEEQRIHTDEEGDEITPDWCPLNKEPITIIKQ